MVSCVFSAHYFLDCVSEQDMAEVDLEIIRSMLYKVQPQILLLGGIASAYSYTFLRRVVCLSVCRLSHSCTVLKPFD